MQSLMGDRLLKWFLNRSRRRFRRADSAQAESKPEIKAAPNSVLEEAGDGQARASDVAHPEAGRGLRRSSSKARASDNTERDTDRLVDDETTSVDKNGAGES
jgi:hypothetical protein